MSQCQDSTLIIDREWHRSGTSLQKRAHARAFHSRVRLPSDRWRDGDRDARVVESLTGLDALTVLAGLVGSAAAERGVRSLTI